MLRCASIPLRNPGKLPLWQDLVIIVSLVALAVIGVLALWGDRLRTWVEPERQATPAEPAEPPPPPVIPGSTL